jgi:hypothetical protein
MLVVITAKPRINQRHTDERIVMNTVQHLFMVSSKKPVVTSIFEPTTQVYPNFQKETPFDFSLLSGQVRRQVRRRQACAGAGVGREGASWPMLLLFADLVFMFRRSL